jgi:hypothetical protein
MKIALVLSLHIGLAKMDAFSTDDVHRVAVTLLLYALQALNLCTMRGQRVSKGLFFRR